MARGRVMKKNVAKTTARNAEKKSKKNDKVNKKKSKVKATPPPNYFIERTPEEMLEVGQELAVRALNLKTLRSYRSHIAQMKKCDCTLDFNGLLRYILCCDRSFSYGLYQGRINAVRWHQRSRLQFATEITKVQEKQLLLFARGRVSTVGRVPKGALTEKHLNDLLGWMDDKLCSKIDKDSIEFCWVTALRTEQMKLVQRHHLRECTDGSWLVVMEEHHNPQRGKRKEAVIVMKPVHKRGYDLIRRICNATKDDNELLFPNWNGNRANAWVKAAAEDYGWDPTLGWHGVHQFRHGRATEIFLAEPNKNGLRRAREVLGHQVNKPQRLVMGAAQHYIKIDQHSLHSGDAKREKHASRQAGKQGVKNGKKKKKKDRF